jgi:predicted deacetylase
MADTRYLIRFDDICPTMNWAAWEVIESLLTRHGVRPILAVVPDNQDPKLIVDQPRADFWEQVRRWQAKGYTIALHGYQHVYVNQNPGMLKLNPQSEFAGLPRTEQQAKLRRALAIFADHEIRAEAWVAPSHSFDLNTVDILRELGLMVISDGLWPRPFTEASGMTWVPQQLWGFRAAPGGVWTICNHHNTWSELRLNQFAESLRDYRSRITDLPTVLKEFAGRKLSLADWLMGQALSLRLHYILAPAWAFQRRLLEKLA